MKSFIVATMVAGFVAEVEEMATVDAFIITAVVVVDFVAGAEEMVTVEAFIVVAAVANFVDGAGEAIVTYKGDGTGLVELVLALTMEDWIAITMDGTGFAGFATSLAGLQRWIAQAWLG